MQAATPAAPQPTGLKNNRVFVLGSLSVGHGLSHMFDQGLPLLITEIAKAMGLSTPMVATLFAVRQAGSSAVSLGGGPLIDALKSYWGLILTACMLGHAVTYAAMGGSPSFLVVAMIMLFVSIPGSLWHLPSTAALSQRFPDRRGFAISMSGFGSNLGNVTGPVLAGVLLSSGYLIWRHVFFHICRAGHPDGGDGLVVVARRRTRRGSGGRRRLCRAIRLCGPDAEKPGCDGSRPGGAAAGNRLERAFQLDAVLPAGNAGDEHHRGGRPLCADDRHGNRVRAVAGLAVGQMGTQSGDGSGVSWWRRCFRWLSSA